MPTTRVRTYSGTMSHVFTAKKALTRLLALGAAAAILGSLAACSTTTAAPSTDTQPETKQATPAEAETDSEFCQAMDGIENDLALLKMSAAPGDPEKFAAQTAIAAERFSSVAPPDSIAGSWSYLGDFFSMANEALEGVDVTNEADLEEALNFDGEDAFAMVIQLPGQSEAVGLFVQETCGLDLGIVPPAMANVCDAFDQSDLDSIFTAGIPEGENRPWGDGVVECYWEDDQGNEVGAVVGPAERLKSEILQNVETVDSVKVDGVTIQVFDGAVGPLRAAGGRTAMAQVADTGVMVSVRTGDSSVEAEKAVALVSLVSSKLS